MDDHSIAADLETPSEMQVKNASETPSKWCWFGQSWIGEFQGIGKFAFSSLEFDVAKTIKRPRIFKNKK